VPVLVIAAFVAGLGTAPLLITSFGMVETMVSGRALTEGFSWVLTGLSIGYGAGSSLVGGIADAHGARVGFTVTVGAGLLAGGAGLLLWRRLTGSPAESRPVAVG
jgi:MFS family permease